MKTNYHTHTTFSDGANTPEEMIEAAIERGFSRLGISDHIDMIADIDDYLAELERLKAKYRGRIEVLAGVESEGFRGLKLRDRLDYVIGSFHYVNGRCYDDKCRAFTREEVLEYFAFERHLAMNGVFDVLAHPDLVLKFNEKVPSVDVTSDWYRLELELTADVIAASGRVVEVNTGAISRGWRSEAYPAPDFRKMLRDRGVRFILSSDAHSAAALDCAFDVLATSENFTDLV